MQRRTRRTTVRLYKEKFKIMDLIVLSLAPVFIIAGYIYFRDKYEREPIRLLLLSLFFGALTVIPVMFVGQFFDGFTSLFAEFNDKLDGIVYAVFISLGFAAVENVLYVLGNGYGTGIMRAVTAVPAHAVFGITMGFYFGMAKFYEKQQYQLKLKALFYPIVLHGIYNFILFTGIGWLTIVFLAFLIYLYFSGLKRIKKLSDQSIYKTDFNLLNEKFGSKNQG